MRKGLELFGITLAMLGGALSLVYALNRSFNNQTIHASNYDGYSESKWLVGHTEYIRYEDGSQQVAIFPQTGWQRIKLYDDFNGDGAVDRIRENSNRIQFNRLKRILIRTCDSTTHAEEFAEADSLLQTQAEKARGRFK